MSLARPTNARLGQWTQQEIKDVNAVRFGGTLPRRGHCDHAEAT